ncbi:unnamed protein product [Discula destructiva]
MAIFKNPARLALVLLGAGVPASAIEAVMADPIEVVKPHELTGGPGGDLLVNITHTICQPTDYVFAVDPHLAEGITYLQGKDGSSQFGWQAGGGLCTRVSCSENSGIYVCNDNEYDINVYYDTMAAYTQYLMDYVPANVNDTECTWYQKNVDGSPFNKIVTSGQVFDSNGFNIVAGMLAGTNC